MRGQTVGEPVNPCLYLWLTPELFDGHAFEQLHEKTRETIAKSPEYQAISRRETLERGSENPAEGLEDMNDDVPF
jgi:hypothetical protein